MSSTATPAGSSPPSSSPRERADAEKALGNACFTARQYEQSIAHYSAAIALDATNHVYYSNRSASYGALHQWTTAKEDAETCIRLEPSFAKGYLRLANAQRHLKERSAALQTLTAGLALAPEDKAMSRLVAELTTTPETAIPQPSPRHHRQLDIPPAVAAELNELQPKLQATVRELDRVAHQVQSTSRDVKRLELTTAEVVGSKKTSSDDLPANVYRAVGKMFLHTSNRDLETFLREKQNNLSSKSERLEARRVYLQRQKTSLEGNIQELVAQCQTVASS